MDPKDLIVMMARAEEAKTEKKRIALERRLQQPAKKQKAVKARSAGVDCDDADDDENEDGGDAGRYVLRLCCLGRATPRLTRKK